MKRLFLPGMILTLLACGDDNGTGPSNEVSFPTIAPTYLSSVCIRGTAVPTTSKSGSITDDDCDSGGVVGYFETYRVRVASSGNVTFTVSSTFDSVLALARIGDTSDPVNTMVELAGDDDSAGNLDAELTYMLQPNTEYWVLVAGYDYSETGSYIGVRS